MVRPEISVVVPAYNEEKYLGDCLTSLLQQKTHFSYEVVVVDNASTDATATVAKRYAIRMVKEKRKGRGFARQRGFRESYGELILATEADAFVPSCWIETLGNHLTKSNYQAATGTMRIRELSQFKRWCINVGQPLSLGMYQLLYGYPFFCGFNMGIQRGLFEKVGGFNTGLTTLDDVELAQRVSQQAKIHILWDIPVVVSARRFRNNFWQGIKEYIVSNYQFHQGRLPDFTDPR